MGSWALRRSHLGILSLAALLVCAGLTMWRREAAQSSEAMALLEPLPQDSLIQSFFNQSQSSLYRDPYRQQERLGDDLEQVIVDAILSAQMSVDVAVQELRLPRIAEALRDRAEAGVRVRVILENNYSRPTSSLRPQDVAQLESRDRARYEENLRLIDQNQDGTLSAQEIARNDALVILQKAGIPIIDDRADGSRGSDLMHHKFVVVDERTVVVGSANFTLSDIHGDFSSPESRGNPNHVLRIHSATVAQAFTSEFNLMWGDGPGGQPDSLFGLQKPARSPQSVPLAPDSALMIQFSPQSSTKNWWESTNGLIGRSLYSAAHSIDLALFVFSDQRLSYVLESKQKTDVSIRALVDESFVYRPYSEALDLMGVALPNNACKFDAGNKPWETPLQTVGTPQLPAGDLLHHKFAVVDGHTVIMGSQNWSEAANHQNDENVLVIRNATVAAHFQREFERLYQDAVLGVPEAIATKIQQENARCNL
ncbi:phospholipase D-like domain-containing protein [Leptolyngbya sp. AN02str]|uniref:phospholipase D-like domain-containing protein n=1 Tax=Leptolyngbya sp. AN02str TaxID=3423363 RepID=UPI003D31C16F